MIWSRSLRALYGVPLKVREVIKLLERNGWRHVRTSGDHRIFENADGRTTVVAGKLGEDIPRGTYRGILRQTGIEDPAR
jgi:predicted RNA binding protein YcfA (HicA-like mRNA interferase family)